MHEGPSDDNGALVVKKAITLCPVVPLKHDRYRYEHYREAWVLLAKHRRELAQCRMRKWAGVNTGQEINP